MTGFDENVKKPWFLTLNPHIRIFFKILAVSLSLLYWPLTSCKVSEKTNYLSPRYSKMDWRTDKQGRLLWTSSGKHGDQNGHPKLENNLFHAKKHFGLSQDMPEERCIPPGKVFKEHKGLYSERLRYQNVYVLWYGKNVKIMSNARAFKEK